jgi:preprotein translocase subunit Sec63
VTPGDVILIAGCLVIGYMTVSFLMKRRDPTVGAKDAPRAEDAAGGAPPPWAQVLGVAPTAGIDEIREAYRRLVAQYHPDKVAQLGPELQALANEKTQAITAAYQDAVRERASLKP